MNLRALEPSDIEILYCLENDPEIWKISQTLTPYSKYTLQLFIDTAPKDIFTTKQLRLMIENPEIFEIMGIIDLFDFEPLHQRVGVGIIVTKNYRNQGIAFEAIEIVKHYLFNSLLLKQLYCHVLTDNEISILLFQKAGFIISGTLKAWINTSQGYKDVFLMQCLRD